MWAETAFVAICGNGLFDMPHLLLFSANVAGVYHCTFNALFSKLDVYECIAMLSSHMYMLLKVQPGFTGFGQM